MENGNPNGIARETNIYNVGAQVVGSGPRLVGAMGPGFRVVGGWSPGPRVVGAQGPRVFWKNPIRHLNPREPPLFQNTAPSIFVNMGMAIFSKIGGTKS